MALGMGMPNAMPPSLLKDAPGCHSRRAIVHWLIVVIYCPPRVSDSVWSTG